VACIWIPELPAWGAVLVGAGAAVLGAGWRPFGVDAQARLWSQGQRDASFPAMAASSTGSTPPLQRPVCPLVCTPSCPDAAAGGDRECTIYTVRSMAFVQSAGFTLLSFALVISVGVLSRARPPAGGKALGVRAIRFSIGFGPSCSASKGRTRNTGFALPLGGLRPSLPATIRTRRVAPEDRGPRLLEQPPWEEGPHRLRRAGSHFILAIVLYFVV